MIILNLKKHNKFYERFSLTNPWTQIMLSAIVTTLARGSLQSLNSNGGYGTTDLKLAYEVNITSSLTYALTSWSSCKVVTNLGYKYSAIISSFVTFALLTSIHLNANVHILVSLYLLNFF